MSYSSHYFILKKFLDFFLTYLIILITSVSCDSETWRNRYTDKIHLSEVCTLTAKNFAHLRISFGLSIAERINSFFVHFVIGSKILYNSSYYQFFVDDANIQHFSETTKLLYSFLLSRDYISHCCRTHGTIFNNLLSICND